MHMSGLYCVCTSLMQGPVGWGMTPLAVQNGCSGQATDKGGHPLRTGMHGEKGQVCVEREMPSLLSSLFEGSVLIIWLRDPY